MVSRAQPKTTSSMHGPTKRDTTGAQVPLTTPYVQPDICTDPAYLGSSVSQSGQSGRSSTGYGIRRSLGLGCFPPFFLSASGTYSPGMCPVGYETAKSSVSGVVTSAVCCPTGGWTAKGPGCIKPFTNKPQLVQSFVVTGDKFTPTTLTDYTLSTYAVHVLYRKADLSEFPSDYTPGSVYTTGETNTDSTPTTSTTGGAAPTNAPPSKHSGGLGTGAIVAIVLCTVALLLGLALGAYFLLRRRKQKRTSDHAFHTSPESAQSTVSKPTIELESPTPIQQRAAVPKLPMMAQDLSMDAQELDSTQINELPGSEVHMSQLSGPHVEPKSLSGDLLPRLAFQSRDSLSKQDFDSKGTPPPQMGNTRLSNASHSTTQSLLRSDPLLNSASPSTLNTGSGTELSRGSTQRSAGAHL